MNYQCPKCGGTFSTPQPVQSAQCPFCNEVVQLGPQPQQAYQQPQQQIGVFDNGPSGKSRGIAALLALLLGPFGAHYFYCGKTTGGVISLVLLFLTAGVCGLQGILNLVQGIMLLTMSQEDFENKWVNSSSSMPLF